MSILEMCHSSPVGGHYSGLGSANKILKRGYYRSTIHKDTQYFTPSL